MERDISKFINVENRLVNLLLVGRPWNGFLIGLIAAIGYIFSITEIDLVLAIFLFVNFMIVYVAGATLNDVYDYEIDKHNMPYRPLQNQKVSLNEAKIFALTLYLISIILSIQNLHLLFGITMFIFFSLIYSVPPINLVKRHFFANINLALVTVLIPALTGISTAINSFDFPIQHLLAFVSLFFLFFGVSLLKDLKDIEGDKKGSKLTVAIIIGEENTKLISALNTSIFFAASVLFFTPFVKNQNLFSLFSSLIFIFLIFATIKKSDNLAEKYLHEEQRFARARLSLFSFVVLILLLHF